MIVRSAPNGEEGTLLFSLHPPDLVITDVLMPDKEGLETIRELQVLNPLAKIIAILVAPSDWRVLEMADKLGAGATIPKTFQNGRVTPDRGTIVTSVLGAKS